MLEIVVAISTLLYFVYRRFKIKHDKSTQTIELEPLKPSDDSVASMEIDFDFFKSLSF